MFPKIPSFHVKIPKNMHKQSKKFSCGRIAQPQILLSEGVCQKLSPLTVFCLTDRRLTVSVKPKPTFGSVSELLSKNFFEQVVVGGYETLFSVGLEVLKSLHVDLTENSIEIYKKKMTMDWRRACCKNVWLRGFNTELNRNSDLTKLWWWLRFLRKTEISWNYHSLRYLVQEYWTWLWNGW